MSDRTQLPPKCAAYLIVLLVFNGCWRPQHRTIEYGNATFVSDVDQIRFPELLVTFTRDDPQTCPLYVRVGNLDPILIHELSEGYFDQHVFDEEDWERHTWKQNKRLRRRTSFSTPSGLASRLVFLDGKPSTLKFHEVDGIFSFAPTREGPFLSLGLNRDQIVDYFGKPSRCSWIPVATGP